MCVCVRVRVCVCVHVCVFEVQEEMGLRLPFGGVVLLRILSQLPPEHLFKFECLLRQILIINVFFSVFFPLDCYHWR